MSSLCRIGVLQLADSAPVLVAHARDIFPRYGLKIQPVVMPSWANVADGLVWNGLDGALMFPPLAIMTALGQRGRAIGLRPGLPVSRGGNSIVLRGQAAAQSAWISEPDKKKAFHTWQSSLNRKPRLAVVHLYSTHYLILTRFLKKISVCRNTETDIVVMPPARMIEALLGGEIDGFCAGPPWGADAQLRHLAFAVSGSAATVPDHLEKMLILTDQWKMRYPDETKRLYSALSEAAILCNQSENSASVAALLSAKQENNGLNLPEKAVRSVLSDGKNITETMSFNTHIQTPELSFGWMIRDMLREGWLTPDDLTKLSALGWC